MEKVLIIGAGPAGLTAAYELLKNNKDYQVTILEESDVIGGISRTVRFESNGYRGTPFLFEGPKGNEVVAGYDAVTGGSG